MSTNRSARLSLEPLEERRVLTAGDLDLTFGGDGRVTTDFLSDSTDKAEAVAILANGSILAAGKTTAGGTSDFALARYLANGSLDPTFNGDGNSDGWVNVDFNSGADSALAIVPQGGGKIIVAGRANGGLAGLARFNADGSLDASFDGDGKVTTDAHPGVGQYIRNAAIQPDGRIVVVIGLDSSGSDFIVVRYDTNGSLDTSFGGTGIVTTNFSGGSDRSIDLVIEPSGTILVVGSSGSNAAAARYDANGNLDLTFGNSGTKIIGTSAGSTMAVDRQPDGKFVVGTGTADYSVFRLLANGELDNSFGVGGVVTTAITGSEDQLADLVLQPDGKILAAGAAGRFGGGTLADFALVRYLPNGELDSTFDEDGIVRTDFLLSQEDFGLAVALQPDGKIVMAGVANEFAASDFALARFEGDAPQFPIDFGDAPDTSMGTAGGNYNTLSTDDGPSHTRVVGLFMGAAVDGEVEAFPNAQAAGDDVNQALPDDEDGLNNPMADLVLTVGAQPTVNVIVTNSTGSAATLFGWIDYDADGVFDNATERAAVAVPNSSNNVVKTLTFPAVPAGFTGQTYARFRLSTDSAAGNPTGSASDGEVEDYVATITQPSSGIADSARSKKIAHQLNGGPTLVDNDIFGGAIASLGDIDNDGVTDLAVGADQDDSGGNERGAVHILLLNADGTVKTPLKIASGVNGGPTLVNGDTFGSSLAALGDLDGDGVTDLAVGAHGDSFYRGAVYVLFLNPGGTVKNSTKIASATNGGPVLSEGGHFGSSVASLGDVNGDGVTDLAVGADRDSTVGPYRGAVYVLFLNPSGAVSDSLKIASGAGGGPTLADGDAFGVSLAPLGDLDGNGANDLAVGANRDDAGGADRGAVHILFLNAGGTVDNSVKIASGTGGGPTLANGDSFGRSVGSLGDLDGDGASDLAVAADADDTGQTDAGAVHVLFMNPTGTVKGSQKIASGMGGGPVLAQNDRFGAALASLGDLDGDGVADLAIGADSDNTGGASRGAVHVLFLKESVDVSVTVSPASAAENGVDALTYTFSRTGDTSAALPVNFTFSGTASFIDDYTQTGADSFAGGTGVVTIPIGSSSKTVVITSVLDSLVEQDETVELTVAPSAEYGVGAPSTASGAIDDNDTATFSIDNVTMNEADGTFTITISLSNPIDTNATVNLTFTDVTTDDPDFNHTPVQVTFFPGETSVQTDPITIANDLFSEGDETFFASLALDASTPLDGRQVDFLTDTGTGTIVDNDIDLAVSQTESADPVTAGSGVGNLVYVVTVANIGLTAASGVAVSEILAIPTGVSVDSVLSPTGSVVSQTATAYHWLLGNLGVGACAKLTVTFTIGVAAAAGVDVVSGTAAIFAANETLVNPLDDSATVSTSIIEPALGTNGNDKIRIRPTAGPDGPVNVNRIISGNEVVIRTFAANEQIVVFGLAGNDQILVIGQLNRNVIVFGNEGQDNIDGGNGVDTLHGGSENDNLDGGAGDDLLHGNSGEDVLLGGPGDDVLTGGTEDDRLEGAAGNDDLRGEIGNDLLRGGTGNDLLDGGTEDDTLEGGAGNDVLRGGVGNDNLKGNDGHDILLGGEGDDTLAANAGFDFLMGGLGLDQLTGSGQGNSLLIGGQTSHDNDDQALLAILAEWSSGAPLLTRIDHLKTPSSGGLNGDVVLTVAPTVPETVLDDAAADILTTSFGNNWIFKAANDTHNGLKPTDVVTTYGP